MKRTLHLLPLLALLAAAACNTVAGAGRDIQTGGSAISGTAKDVQSKL